MATYEVRNADTQVPLASTLTDRTGAPVDLTGATVSFRLVDWMGTSVLNAAATIVTPSAGKVSYTLQAADTARATTYRGKWVVTFSGGGVQTFPTAPDDYLVVVY